MSGDHALLAPSSAARWVQCPASARLAQQYPDVGESESAREGTAAHWLASERLLTGLYPEATEAPNGVEITEEIREGAETYVDFVEGLGITPVYVEERLDVTNIHDTCWGTVDAYGVRHSRLRADIIDFKFGHRPVDVFENWQVLAYAAGVADLIGADAQSYEYHLHVVQPRVYRREGPVVSWVVSGPELFHYIRHLRTAAEEALGNNPRAITGPECRDCPARHACPALRAAALDATETARTAGPIDLTNEALSVELRLLRQAQTNLDARLTGLETQAMSVLQSGAKVPGWTIEHTPGREVWMKPAAEVLALGEAVGVRLAKPVDVITPAQARKAGVPAELTAVYAGRKSGTAKLVPITTNDARRAFGGK